jgi:hypothetical protein
MSASSEPRGRVRSVGVRGRWLGPGLGMLALGGLGLFASACAKSRDTAAPMHSTDVAQGEAQRSSADPLAELDALEARMRQLGLPVAGPSLVGSTSSTREREAAGGEAAGADADMVEEAESAPAEDSEAPAFAAEPPASDLTPDPSSDPGEACMNVCDLHDMICTLEAQICSLAGAHEGERIYADACRRAREDCDVAGDACERCAG